MEASYDVAREVIEVDELKEGSISTAAGKQDWLSWVVPHSGLKLKNEKRKIKNEKWKMKNKKWKMKNEKWKTIQTIEILNP